MKRITHSKLFLSLFFVGMALFASGTIYATWGTPPQNVGFFTGKTDSGSDYTHVIANLANPSLPGLYPILGSQPKDYPVTPTKQAFIDYILGKLGSQSSYSGANQDQIGAAFIIQTMIGGAPKSWPSSANISDWENRLNSSNIAMYMAYGYTIPKDPTTGIYKNSGYSTSMQDDAWINQPATNNYLAFADLTSGKIAYLKTDCANGVADFPPLPVAAPVVTVTKEDTSHNTTGPYKDDTINVTDGAGITSSSSAQGYTYNLTSEGTVTVKVDNKINNWTVTSYSYIACNTAAGGGCASSQPQPPGTFTGAPYTFNISNAKKGYTYKVTLTYKQVVSPIIKGYKVDETGNKNQPISSDSIFAYPTSSSASSSSPAPSSAQPYTLNITEDSYNIQPSSNIVNWIVVGYTMCDAVTPGCDNVNLPSVPNTKYTAATSLTFSFQNNHTYYIWWVYRYIPPQQGGNSTCPTFPNSIVTVPLPGTSGSYPSTSPTTIPGNRVLQITPIAGTTAVTGVQDLSIGGSSVFATLLNPPKNVKQSQNFATLDYKPYIQTYPYDSNQAGVTYTDDAKYTPYVSSSTPSFYTCADGSTPNSSHICTASKTTATTLYNTGTATTTYCTQGGTWNGTNCGTYTSPTPTSYTYSCPSGQTLSGSGSSSVCTTSYPAVDHWTCSNSTATWNNGKTCLSVNRIHHYVCPYGGTLVSTSCVVTYPATATPVYGQLPYPSPASIVTYSCTYPYTGGGTSSTCSYTLVSTTYTYTPATAWYNYTQQSSYTQTNSYSASGTVMPACYPRKVTVSAIDSTGANVSLNNVENPTNASAGGYKSLVQFTYPSTGPQNVGLRLPMKANLTYSYRFSNGCSGSNTYTVTGGLGPDTSPKSYSIPGPSTCGVSMPPLAPGDTVCASYTVTPTGGNMYADGNIFNPTGGSVPSGTKCSGPIVNEPYFKVFGGDVSAGSAFATTSSSGASTCSSNNTGAGVYGWNTAADPVYGQHYAGSGAQFAVTSPNVILGVASNQNNINANPSAGSPNPLGLSFSNTVNNSAPAGQFGGKLTANCITDFYSSKPATGTVDISGSQNLNGLNGTYTMSGGSTINQSNISSGKHITIYASGDVFISGDITFPGSYATINQIPSLILIVKGNIYISNNVKTLSGIFIAQPTTSSSTDGYIYDCAAGAGLFVSPNSIYSGCGNQLVVNGSFIANKVSLMRTGITTGSPISSSLRGSITIETNVVTNKSPAEIFNYGPAFWMNLSLPQATSTGTSSAGYDSIISLPPIL